MTITISPEIKKKELTSGTKEWADYNVNCIKGCSNNCRYCYGKMMAKRFGRCKDGTWKEMIVNQGAVEKNYRKYKGRVMFPSTHDITDDFKVKEACFTVIKKLLDASNDLLITTKPKVTIIKEIVKRFSIFKEQIQFRFTITSLDDNILTFWEPNAPGFQERFESLKYAYNNKYKTSVSIEPFLDNTPQRLINLLSPYVTESIWLGPMNYISRSNVHNGDEEQYSRIRRNYETDHLLEIYNDLKNTPLIRFKDSMSNRLKLGTQSLIK